jgi:hypothetical protein
MESRFWEIDPFSTARSFVGWRDLADPDTPRDGLEGLERLPCAPSQTWLMNVGWQRRGLIRVGSVPGPVVD